MNQTLIPNVYLQNRTGAFTHDDAGILNVYGDGYISFQPVEEPIDIPTLDYSGQAAAFLPLLNQAASRDGPEQPLLIPALEFGERR